MKDARTGEPLILTGQPLALDLCCGKGGWTNGLLAAGYQVIGVDIEDMGGYEGYLILTDVKTLDVKIFKGLKFQIVVASPPCQEFSYRSFPFKKCKNLPPPSKEIWKNCERIASQLNTPLIIENVRGAQPYMGKAMAHYGSFYLWGDVPALLPIGRPVKGFKRDKGINPGSYENGVRKCFKAVRKGFAGEYERENGLKRTFKDASHTRDNFHWNDPQLQKKDRGGTKLARKEWSARIAMIPIELSEWIGQCFK